MIELEAQALSLQPRRLLRLCGHNDEVTRNCRFAIQTLQLLTVFALDEREPLVVDRNQIHCGLSQTCGFCCCMCHHLRG